MKRSVDRSRLEEHPHLLWNAFVDLITTEPYEDLSPLQRKTHLVYWYMSEVENGGHGQYFENQGWSRLNETVTALNDLGLTCQAHSLARATIAISGVGAAADWTEVLSDEFVEELDEAYTRCLPTVEEGLGRHLVAHMDEYIEMT